MDTSTPSVPHGDLRRRTLLKNAANISPLRRSFNASFTQGSLLEITNDETERSNRRNNAEMQKRLSNISQNVVNLNESFVKQQFVVCTHLFTENKITTKNAWKLQIIDLLKPLCQKTDKDKLQVASTSIDISAKVYSIRVDDVHADGLKLASNMARVTDKENIGVPIDGDDGVDEDDPDKPNKQNKKKKKRRINLNGEKNTVCIKKGNLGTLPRLEPSDFTTRVNAEAGQIDNLFTNVLKEDNSNYTFVLLDNNVTLLQDNDPIVENLNQKDNPIKLSDLPSFPNIILKLNPHFQDFKVGEWDPDQEDLQLNVEKVVFDDQGVPIPELDGSIHDIFENEDNMDVDLINDDDIQSIHEELAPQLRGEVVHIVDFRSINDGGRQTSEYSFNSIVNTNTGKFIDQIWAGPCHWKLKFIRRSSTRFSGQKTVVQENKQKRKKAQPEMLNFNEIDVDYSQVLRIKKRPQSVDINKITLPIQNRSCIKLMETIRELMLKPGVCPVEKKTVDNRLDYNVDPYKYENPNDSLYCSQNTGDDGAGDGDMSNFSAEEDQVVPAHQNFAGENLVDAPEMVTTWNVPYALKAKQMDMKKLKAAIWLKLTESAQNLLNTNLQDRNGTVVHQNFSDMYKHLPNLLLEKDRKELTCPLAFVALLHLCNEQNLALTQLPGYKDFSIKGPK